MNEKIVKTVDARGLFCPLPILKTAEKLATMKKGEILEVVISDSSSINDLKIWCSNNNNRIVEIKKISDEEVHFIIEKG